MMIFFIWLRKGYDGYLNLFNLGLVIWGQVHQYNVVILIMKAHTDDSYAVRSI